MILCPFRLLTFLEKSYHTPFFHFVSFSLKRWKLCNFFLKKTHLFVIRIYFFHIHLVIHSVIRLVIWCFPIWLTSSLSYPMAIFSANILKTFLWDIFLFTLWTFSFIGHFHGTKAKQHGDSFFRVYSWHLKEALLRKIHYLFCCSCKAITNK